MNSSFLNDYFYSNPNTFNTRRDDSINGLKSTINIAPANEDFEFVNFKNVRQNEACTLKANETLKILLLKWSGSVNINSTKKNIAATINSIKLHGYTKLILDQSELEEFDTESRVWIKEFLKHNSAKFNDQLTHLASIRPKTISGNIFSNFASEIIREALPNLKLKRFEKIKDAMTWLTY